MTTEGKRGLTKLEVAQREINAAVRLLFSGADPIAILVLAAAARGIVTTLCEKQGIKSFFDDVQDEHPHLTRREIFREANRHSNWFKHAEEDAEDVLEGFKPSDADMALFCAIYDFGSICKGKSVEAQVFEGWFLTLYGNPQDTPAGLDDFFPNLRNLSRPEQLALGKKRLAWALAVPDFQMTYSLEVRLNEPE